LVTACARPPATPEASSPSAPAEGTVPQAPTTAENAIPFDVERVLSTVSTLSSKDFNGRASGTPNGAKTEEYVASVFKQIGLEPGGDNETYFQEFTNQRGNPAAPYVLEVLDGSQVVKTYAYGTDYKMYLQTNHQGETTAKAVKVTIEAQDYSPGKGQIALVENNTLAGDQTYDAFAKLAKAGYSGVIVGRPTITRTKNQAGRLMDGPLATLPRVSVNTAVFSEIADYAAQGKQIHLKSGYDFREYTARNVIGVLKAKDPTNKCLIVAAHMDHVAPDPDGAWFPGAFDNASGTAGMIEVARALQISGEKPSINVVFVAFAGEEAGLHGSSYYVSKPTYPLKDSLVINLDMLGTRARMPVTALSMPVGQAAESTRQELISILKDSAAKHGYELVESDMGGSDHIPFLEMNVPALTLIDDDAASIHIPSDNIDNVGKDNLERDMTILMDFVHAVAYAGGTQY
jgi:Zn-dependent M28 family amino/carboxypeptidase